MPPQCDVQSPPAEARNRGFVCDFDHNYQKVSIKPAFLRSFQYILFWFLFELKLKLKGGGGSFGIYNLLKQG